MAEIIAGVEIPDTRAVAEATAFLAETVTPLLYHHSRRVFLFASGHASVTGLTPDPELLYLAAMFHDTGLVRRFSDVEQRFEVDGADHAEAFLLSRGFSRTAIETVWNAIALHTTPGIPGRMGPEIASLNAGVLVDAVAVGLDRLDPDLVTAAVAAHPRGDFKTGFLHAFHDGLKDRPNTTYGTINADILAHFEPGFRRGDMVERITESAWPS
ncbi:HD domain-containing protein [Microbacterium maritypicum]|uniref:HD domain-containing protein n=1 Tax=Microbacterium maritypicum TaxID=33918 RepID=UPI0038286FC8